MWSLAVLILEGLKLLTTLSMIGVTLAKEGVLGVRAVLLQICCSKYVATRTTIERGRKRRCKQLDLELNAMTQEKTDGSS